MYQSGGLIESGCASNGVSTLSITNAGAPGQILLVEIGTTSPLTTVSYAGIPLTQLYSSGTDSIYYLLAPEGGTWPISIVQGGSSYCGFYAGYALFSYVDQSPPILHGPFNSTANAWTDTFAPSNANSMVLDFIEKQQNIPTIVNGNLISSGAPGGSYDYYTSYLRASALPFSYSGSCCSQTIASEMVELIPPQGCAGITPTETPTQAPPSATPTPAPAAPTSTNNKTFTPVPPGSTLTDTPTVTLTSTETQTPGPTATVATPAPGGPGFGIVTVYPNPSTTAGCYIVMSVPGPMTVTFKIYDLRGELVWSGSQQYLAGGVYQKPWPATNNAGAAVSYGAYFLTANAGPAANDSKWLTVVR
jgi:hypothetical protein